MKEKQDDPPIPRFTIEELLRKAMESIPATEEKVFSTREIARILGYKSLNSVRERCKYLESIGWRFVPVRKSFVNRAGIRTSIPAYLVIPPEENGAGEEAD